MNGLPGPNPTETVTGGKTLELSKYDKVYFQFLVRFIKKLGSETAQNNGGYKNQGYNEDAVFRAMLPNLFGFAHLHNDHQGMFASILFGVHYHSANAGQQGMPDLQKENCLKAVPSARSKFWLFDKQGF